MLVITHVLLVVLVGLFLVLDREEWFMAVTFGVLLDLDHLFAVERYVGDNGVAALLNATWDDGSGHPWKSLMHYPVGIFIVAPLAFGWRFLIPLLFWGTHLGLDYLQAATLSHSAVVESAMLAGLVAGILALQYSRWKVTKPQGGLAEYLGYVLLSARAALSPKTQPSGRREDTI